MDGFVLFFLGFLFNSCVIQNIRLTTSASADYPGNNLRLPSQALRYPYFQVGQVLGPRPRSHEVKKNQTRPHPQKQVSEPKPNPQQPSSESKASTDSSRSQQQHPQPLQQIPLPQIEKPGGFSHAVRAFMKITIDESRNLLPRHNSVLEG